MVQRGTTRPKDLGTHPVEAVPGTFLSTKGRSYNWPILGVSKQSQVRFSLNIKEVKW